MSEARVWTAPQPSEQGGESTMHAMLLLLASLGMSAYGFVSPVSTFSITQPSAFPRASLIL